MLLQNLPERGRNGAILENRDSSTTLEALRASSRTGWTLQALLTGCKHTTRRSTAFTKRILTAKHDPAALRCRIAPECICAEALPLPHGARRSRRQTMQSSSR